MLSVSGGGSSGSSSSSSSFILIMTVSGEKSRILCLGTKTFFTKMLHRLNIKVLSVKRILFIDAQTAIHSSVI